MNFDIYTFLLRFIVALIALPIHECAHGYAAYRMGDYTAKREGRLTLNPLAHFDIFGTIAMILFGFGWAKPVPINTRNFDNPRKGMALTGIAGPISNLILGLISSVLSVVSDLVFWKASFAGLDSNALLIINIIALFFYISAILNFGLMAFNLIPVPPFDGSRFFYILLPSKWYFKVMKYEQTVMIVILVAFLVLSRAGYSPISYIANGLYNLISEPLLNLGSKLLFT